MKYNEILSILRSNPNEAIKELEKQKKDINQKEIEEQFSVKGHKVLNEAYRKKREVVEEYTDSKGEITTRTKYVDVVRTPLAIQKDIADTAAEFIFANPVKYVANGDTELDKNVSKAFNKLAKKLKLAQFDIDLATEIFSYTQSAEYWYLIKEDNDLYGFDATHKLKVVRFSPKYNELLPYFDDEGDMIAFSRKYCIKEDDVTIYRFETYTKDYIFYFEKKSDSPDYVLVKTIKHLLGKIPIVYGTQENPEWHNVQKLIERLEDILSNHGEINDYHAHPKIVAKGQIMSFAEKGEKGAVIEVEKDGDMNYLSWTHSIDSVQKEQENLDRYIYSLTKTPKIDFETVKGLGSNISGITLKMLFMPATLKATVKKNKFEEYFERRISIIKSLFEFAGAKDFSKPEIEPIITPFTITDDKDTIERLILANCNKPIISQKTSVKLSGLVDNYEEEQKLIEEQQEKERLQDPFMAD